MARQSNIMPIVDSSSSREYYGLHNSQDLYKGTSFKYSGDWLDNTHYYNDEYVVDFVTYDDALWVCIKTHLSSSNNLPSDDNKNWKKVVYSKPGVKGDKGEAGKIKSVSVETLDPGNEAAVRNDGSETDAELVFSIPKGDKGDPGDQNIYIGSVAPDDKTLIWYDTTDNTIGDVYSLKVVYDAYKESGGSLSEEDFIDSFKNINKLGFIVKWATSVEDLGEASEDKLNYLWMTPSSIGDNNSYEEWICIKTEDGIYQWEKIGSVEMNADIDLDNYYTKDEIHQTLESINVNGGKIDVSTWV